MHSQRRSINFADPEAHAGEKPKTTINPINPANLKDTFQLKDAQMQRLFAQEVVIDAQAKSPKRVIYTAKRLNFQHGNLDLRGMEQKLQRFAYKNHLDEDIFNQPQMVITGQRRRSKLTVPQQIQNMKSAIKSPRRTEKNVTKAGGILGNHLKPIKQNS